MKPGDCWDPSCANNYFCHCCSWKGGRRNYLVVEKQLITLWGQTFQTGTFNVFRSKLGFLSQLAANEIHWEQKQLLFIHCGSKIPSVLGWRRGSQLVQVNQFIVSEKLSVAVFQWVQITYLPPNWTSLSLLLPQTAPLRLFIHYLRAHTSNTFVFQVFSCITLIPRRERTLFKRLVFFFNKRQLYRGYQGTFTHFQVNLHRAYLATN